MSLWSTSRTPDISLQRLSFGTVGNAHITPQSLRSTSVQSIIDDGDPHILYGSVDGLATTFSYGVGDFVASGTTYTELTRVNSAIQYHFTGTSIGILGSLTPDSGQITVYIDGVATEGSIPNTGISLSNLGPSAPSIAAADTTINLYAGYNNFPASGRIRVGSELIDYAAKFQPGIGSTTPLRNVPGQLINLTRGVGGTVAQDHYRNETIYLWSASADLSTGGSTALRELIYYNDLLQPGEHRITIVVTGPGSVGGSSNFYFDGFIIGPVIGASNIFSQMQTVTATFTTDANGHASVGIITLTRADISVIGLLGWSAAHAQTSNTTPAGNVGIYFTTGSTPSVYYHNGPASTSVTLTLNLMFLGESI